MYFVNVEYIYDDIETGDLVKHIGGNLFLAIHNMAVGEWLLIGMDGKIFDRIKSYADLSLIYKLVVKSKDLKLSIKRQVE